MEEKNLDVAPNMFTHFLDLKHEIDALAGRLSVSDGRVENMAKAFKGVLERLDLLADQMTAVSEQPRITKTYVVKESQSATIGKIAMALSKAQGSMKLAAPTGNVGMGNSKSADLGDLMEVAVPALEANELAVTFDVRNNEHGEGTIEMKLIHSSGEWLSSHCLLMEWDTMPNEKEFQKKRGGAITYCMKNMYRAMLGMGKE
jgi:hypothetical protein